MEKQQMTNTAAKSAAKVSTITKSLDVLIIGAGISGLGIAYYLQKKHPQKSYAIIDARSDIGGTWDLFRYPGIRSDSDLHTFGYSFKPWTEDRVIADRAAIVDYLKDTAQQFNIDQHIEFNLRVEDANWDTEQQRWMVNITNQHGKSFRYAARWLFSGAGYYSHQEAHAPEFPGEKDFKGQIIHPQFWPKDLDYKNKHVVVIGSGATAVTIVPSIASETASVTMLQRTPSYVMSMPFVDPITQGLKKVFGPDRVHKIAREKNVRLQEATYKLSRRFPNAMRKMLMGATAKELPENYDVQKHFCPPYDPWDQRLCLVPDGDLFKAIKAGKAAIVTDHIERFTENGILLKSGEELKADIIVTATGLKLQAFGGIQLQIDDQPINLSDTYTWKGMMLTGVPNLAYLLGYINISWTLRVDLVGDHFTRILELMDQHDFGSCTPLPPPKDSPQRPFLEFSAGYVNRAIEAFPKQAAAMPWILSMNYVQDRKDMLNGSVNEFLNFEAKKALKKVENKTVLKLEASS